MPRDRLHPLQGIATDAAVDDGDAQQVPQHADREARSHSHARSVDVVPHDRDDGVVVAEPTREEDDLGVEDDATGQQSPEDVAPGGAAEALEAALGVRHVTGDPGSGDAPVDATERAPVERLRGAPVAAVRLDATAQRHVMIDQGFGEQRDLVRRRGHVGVGEDDELAVRGQDARGHGGALAGVRAAQDAESRRRAVGAERSLRTGLHDVGRPVARAVVDDKDIP